MFKLQRNHLRWTIVGVILAISAGIVILALRTPTREVTFLLKFSEDVRPNAVTQGDIDAALGKGYPLTFSDSYGAPGKFMKIVGLKVPEAATNAEIAARLERLPDVKSVDVMTRKR